MTLLIFPDVDLWQFVLSDLQTESSILLFPLKSNCSPLQMVIRKYSPFSFVPASWVIGRVMRRSIRCLKSNDSVVLCEYTDACLISSIASLAPQGVRLYAWLWNHKGNNPSFVRSLALMRRYGYSVWTYDESDAKYYHLQWHHQFFCINRFRKTPTNLLPLRYDFLFIGNIKNREVEIQSVQRQLSRFVSKFIVVHGADEYVPYSQYMEQVSQSRCIVDVVHTGETSCSLRPLEAIALRRKLITNNQNVRSYSFYRSENIFLIGVDDETQLDYFLHSPFVEISDDLVAEYDVKRWARNFQN